jgi:2-dehydro-3-deoxygluconokinase
MSKTTIVTFGEVMGRLCPERTLRLTQVCPGRLQFTFGGAEANVAASIAVLGGQARYVTALPTHAVAESCVRGLRGLGVDCAHILRTAQGRLGLYFVETGANQRPSRVIYDREGSAISITPADQYDWEAIFDGAGWLHLSGITPALSAIAAEATLTAAREARARGIRVSCDLNFRKALWRWEAGTAPKDLARRTMSALLPSVDLVIGNEEDAADVLGIHAAHTDVDAGELAIGHYPEVAEKIVASFPNIQKVAITLRQSHSATHNDWGAMLYDAATGSAHFAPWIDGKYAPYPIKAIVDRVGGGDAFAAGLIYALHCAEFADDLPAVVAFAVASSCLAHSIEGDYNHSTREEVEQLAGGSASGRVVR